MSRLAPPPPALLDRRGKDLPSDRWAYKLAGGQFGLDVAAADGPQEIDERRMAVRIVYADGNRRDGVGDLLEIGGIDFSRHVKNPIHLFDHGKAVTLPLGTVEDPETGQYTGSVDAVAKTASDLVFFYQGKGIANASREQERDHALFCEQIFDLLAKRFIRAGSIGYQVIQAQALPGDPSKGTPPGQWLQKVLKLESSTVVLPANGDTVRKVLSEGRLCGKSLSPVLVKSLQPYCPERKAMTNGIGAGEKGQEIPVPLAELPDDPIPPSRWKPGAGAIKDLRAKYRRKGAMREAAVHEEHWHGVSKWYVVDPDTHEDVPEARGRTFPTEDEAVSFARRFNYRLVPVEYGKGLRGRKSVRGRDRKPSDYSQYRRVEAPKVGSRVEIAGRPGVVTDNRMTTTEVKFDDGRTEWVPMDDVQVKAFYDKRDEAEDRLIKLGIRPVNIHGRLRTFGSRNDRDRALNVYRDLGIPASLVDEITLEVGSDVLHRKGIKSIRVQYRNKLVKGYARVELKFDTSKLTTDQLDAFAKDMAAAGFGKPAGGRWSEGEDAKLLSPLKKSTFTADLEPGSEVHEALGKAANIAKRHGAKFLGNGADAPAAAPTPTSNPQQGAKGMATKTKDLRKQYRKKDMEVVEEAVATGPDGAGAEAAVDQDMDVVDEKLGAHILRRIHEHGQILMQEYHELLEMCENPAVVGFVEKWLGHLEETLQATEELFDNEYQDLDGLAELDAGEEDDKDFDGAVPDDSGAPDVPSSEEAAEALADSEADELPNEKRLAGYGKKWFPHAAGKRLHRFRCKSCGCVNAKDITPGNEEFQDVPGATDYNAAEAAGDAAGLDDSPVKSLYRKDLDSIGGACGFMKECSTHQGEWTDEHRTKAAGWHKALDEIAQVTEDAMAQQDSPVPADPEAGSGDPIPGSAPGDMDTKALFEQAMQQQEETLKRLAAMPL